MPNGQMTHSLAAPIAQQERITIIDSLRGIAILGILLMNIPGFGLAHSAIFDFSLQPQGDLKVVCEGFFLCFLAPVCTFL
jgi:hypothetical protein